MGLARDRWLADDATEILSRALVHGGTEAQKTNGAEARLRRGDGRCRGPSPTSVRTWRASSTSATRTPGGWLINGVRAGARLRSTRTEVLTLLAGQTRTAPSRTGGCRCCCPEATRRRQGFTLAKESTDDRPPGRMEGRPIDTLGYRGMHSYELALENLFVPSDALDRRRTRRGPRLLPGQTARLQNGRLQTASARSRCDAGRVSGRDYAAERKVFGAPIADYQLTKVKLAGMGFLIQATRQFSFEVARYSWRTTPDPLRLDGEGLRMRCAAEWVDAARPCRYTAAWAMPRSIRKPFLRGRPGALDFEGADESTPVDRPTTRRTGV